MEKPTINGVILVLSCQKYKETRLKEFKFPKNEYCSGKWKVIYVLGDLFLDKEFTLNGNIMTIRCEDSYIHLLKKLALAVKYVYQIFDIKEGILRCGDDLVVNESRLELFLNSVKYDFYGQSDMRRDIHMPNIEVLKITTFDKWMINYYSKHPEDFENPHHNLKGVKIEDYAVRPKLIGPYGVLFYISNWACKILVAEMESIDYNIFHKDDFTNSYPYTIEDCGITYIMYKHGIPLRDKQIFFDTPNSIATHTNKYKFDDNIDKKNEKLENNNNENEYNQLSTKYPSTINMYASPLNPSKQKIHFITYGNNQYSKVKDFLAKQAQETRWFDSVVAFNENMLTTEFKTKFADILNQKRGGGYWIWKYDIITQMLNKINDGDILVYADGGCYINPKGKGRFLEYIDMLNNDKNQYGIISFNTGCCEKQFTTKQIFEHFKIPEDSELRSSGQLNATCSIIKKTPHLLMLLQKYREVLDQNPLLFTDHYNTNGQDDCFKDNRHDQSVFSIIRKKYGCIILRESAEVWWAGNNFSCEEAQTRPFWATRLTDVSIVKQVQAKQKIHFITYGNNKFSKVKDMLAKQAIESDWFDSVVAFNENMLTSEFKTKFANILNQPRGGGYWIWKYDIIMQTLNKINDGDIIVYVDGGSYLNLNGKKWFLEYIDMLNNDEKQLGLISFDNGICEEKYTTKQIFEHFKIPEDSEIRRTGQYNGGYYYIKKTSHLLMLFEKYRETLEQNPLLFTDNYNANGQDDCFKDNRHDQSVFSVIRKKYGTLGLKELGEFWWQDNNFECEEAQTKPFWATRLKDMGVVTIGSEGKGSWGKRIINGLVGHIAPKFPWFKKPSFLYANTQECNLVVKSHFNNEEPPWNRSMKPYLLWSGESYTVPIPPNASKYLHIASTFIDDPNSIYVPYVLDSPYLYQERCLNGDRKYLLAYCSSNPVILREILFNKFVEKAGKDQCHALGKCFGGMYPETHRKLEGTWESEQLIDEYKKYKFVFAIENKKVPGYVTEKIMNAFHAGAIPIYWGSDNIGELFNSDAFINVSDFDSFDACVNHVTSMSEENIEKMREQEIYNENSDIIHLLDSKYKNNKVLHEYLQKIVRTIS
jgi:hypothetical protein